MRASLVAGIGAIGLAMASPAFADGFKLPATGKDACALALAKPEAVFPHARLDARRVSHGAICAYSDAANRALVVVQCVAADQEAARTDGAWADLDDGLAGTTALGDKAAFVQRFDGPCVVTVQATGAWSKTAREAAKTVHLGTAAVKSAPGDFATKDQVIVSVTSSGKLFLAGVEIELAGLPAAFAAIAARDKSIQVVIMADRNVSHATVVAVMERAKAAGLTRLAIGTAAAP